MAKMMAVLTRSTIGCLSFSVALTVPQALADDGDEHGRRKIACTELPTLKLDRVTINSAEIVPAATGVADYCRVRGRVDTEINFEIGLPTAWNGKF